MTDTVLSPPPSPSTWECGYPGSLWVGRESGHGWPWGQTPAGVQRAGPGHSPLVMPARETLRCGVNVRSSSLVLHCDPPCWRWDLVGVHQSQGGSLRKGLVPSLGQ